MIDFVQNIMNIQELLLLFVVCNVALCFAFIFVMLYYNIFM